MHLHNNYDDEEKTNKKNIEIEGVSVKSLNMWDGELCNSSYCCKALSILNVCGGPGNPFGGYTYWI